MGETIEFLSSVLLVSKDPERLATFYREVIGLPLQDEQHGETEKHYGCELGDIHFAIHPVGNFQDKSTGTGAVKLAFTVFDVLAFAERVKAKGIPLVFEPKDAGFAWMTALRDPDGNYIEFTQLSDRWFKYLEGRRTKGFDMLARWQAAKH